MIKALAEAAKILAAKKSEARDFGLPDFSDKNRVSVPFSAANFRKIGLDACNNYETNCGISAKSAKTNRETSDEISAERSGDACAEKNNDACRNNACRKIAFIDAGNMEILSAPNFSVHLIRAYCGIFSGKKRIVPKNVPQKIEFFCVASASPPLASSEKSDGRLNYCGTVIPASQKHPEIIPKSGDLSFDSFDPALSKKEGFRADISSIGAVARRYCERLFACELAKKELGSGDIIVHDGTLQPSVSGEDRFIEMAADAAFKNGIALAALAKTTALLTTSGIPLAFAVQALSDSLSPKISAPWAYYPLFVFPSVSRDAAKTEKTGKAPAKFYADILMCNFHESGKRPLRLEIMRRLEGECPDYMPIFCAIADNCRDATFPGYPYGLIDADYMSRISFAEGEMYRAALFNILNSNGSGDYFRQLEASKDAHDVLNENRI